jgi:hypothetical protein
MAVIDVQVHAYERNHPARPWVGQLHGIGDRGRNGGGDGRSQCRRVDGMLVNFLCRDRLDDGTEVVWRNPDTVVVIDHLGVRRCRWVRSSLPLRRPPTIPSSDASMDRR